MIAKELQEHCQWACAKPGLKSPTNTIGRPVSVHETERWLTYEQAKGHCRTEIGFILTPLDPYCVIDLDKPQNKEQAAYHQKILHRFKDTYCEKSMSGEGWHIWVKGEFSFNGINNKEHNVELYCQYRFMICTGNSNNKPILKRQKTIDKLVRSLGQEQLEDKSNLRTRATLGQEQLEDKSKPDKEAMRAINRGYKNSSIPRKRKFQSLLKGKWQEYYPSQSEADYYMLTLICSYSPSDTQAVRLFRKTGLGKREKATKNSCYLLRSIRKIRAVFQISKERIKLDN